MLQVIIVLAVANGLIASMFVGQNTPYWWTCLIPVGVIWTVVAVVSGAI